MRLPSSAALRNAALLLLVYGCHSLDWAGSPFASTNLVSVAQSGPQQLTTTLPWSQPWQQQQQQQVVLHQQTQGTGGRGSSSSGPWTVQSTGGETVTLQSIGPGSWQPSAAPWHTNSVAMFNWQQQQHNHQQQQQLQQAQQQHHQQQQQQAQQQQRHQQQQGPPADSSLQSWNGQGFGSWQQNQHQQYHPHQHHLQVQQQQSIPWQSLNSGNVPWQHQQQQQQQSQAPQQQQQQMQAAEGPMPRTQVKLIYVPIPIVKSVSAAQQSPQSSQWAQSGGTQPVSWPPQQQQQQQQPQQQQPQAVGWQPGIRARAYSLATRNMGSAGAVIPIVISLQTTTPSRTSATSAKTDYSPRVATARSSAGNGSWW